MTRNRYFLHVLGRVLASAAVMAAAGLLALLLQDRGILGAPALPRSWGAISRAASLPLSWVWPLLFAGTAHVVLGPKQRRPVYLRIPGAMYSYAGVIVDRNAGCRGGCVTGSTGSGKTLCCIVPRLHSLCVNEAGVERRGWRSSSEQSDLERLEKAGASRDARLAREINARARSRRYIAPPWGGFVCGEKGNEWVMLERLLRCHQRAKDLCVLKVRPAGAPAGWVPRDRLNLLSMDEIPADTYARLIVETGLAIEESGTRDEFFVPQARDKIAWGLRLVRSVAASAGAGGPGFGLLTLLDILTVQESYRRFLMDCTAADPGLEASASFCEARFQLENNYWSQPADQLGGVRSTIYNFLVPFAEPEIAQVFCADSTVVLRDVEHGKVFTLAIPQKFALQRRYVATLLKGLVYQIVLERFDRGPEHAGWHERNVILVEQDEWQRHAVAADCDVDVVREANGAVYAATQSQNAVWLKLGGRERAAPLIANLRNRWICQAATEECAEESSGLVSARVAREVSYSRGSGGSTTSVSFAERPLLPKRELRSLPPFHVVFAPAEGPWHYRKCVAMPATPDGEIPHWWFGDWNPLHWAAHACGTPERMGWLTLHLGARHVPPWRSAAPLRAQVRWLLGLDGTFIILGGRRSAGGSD